MPDMGENEAGLGHHLGQNRVCWPRWDRLAPSEQDVNGPPKSGTAADDGMTIR
jgi:hypothetical protein